MSPETMAAETLSAQPWLWLPGTALIVAALTDVLVTSLQGGEGRLTRWAYQAVYSGLQGLRRLSGDQRVLNSSGPVMVLSGYLLWCVLTWAGWTLVLLSQPGGLLWSSTGQPASPADVAYYAGYTLTTLGYGDMQAQTSAARLLSVAASLNGFFILTFTLTFLAPLAQVHNERRALALYLHRWGPGPYDLLLRGQQHSGGLCGLMDAVGRDLTTLDTKHYTAHYLHRLHDHRCELDLSYALPILGDALVLIQALREPPGNWQPVRDSLAGLSLSYHRVQPPGSAPLPPLSLDSLRRAGLNVISDAEFQRLLEQETPFRRGLYDMAERGGHDLSRMAPLPHNPGPGA